MATAPEMIQIPKLTNNKAVILTVDVETGRVAGEPYPINGAEIEPNPDREQPDKIKQIHDADAFRPIAFLYHAPHSFGCTYYWNGIWQRWC
jgi:hypothetical protein